MKLDETHPHYLEAKAFVDGLAPEAKQEFEARALHFFSVAKMFGLLSEVDGETAAVIREPTWMILAYMLACLQPPQVVGPDYSIPEGIELDLDGNAIISCTWDHPDPNILNQLKGTDDDDTE